MKMSRSKFASKDVSDLSEFYLLGRRSATLPLLPFGCYDQAQQTFRYHVAHSLGGLNDREAMSRGRARSLRCFSGPQPLLCLSSQPSTYTLSAAVPSKLLRSLQNVFYKTKESRFTPLISRFFPNQSCRLVSSQESKSSNW